MNRHGQHAVISLSLLIVLATRGVAADPEPAGDRETPAGDANAQVDAALQSLAPADFHRLPIGHTRQGTRLWCLTPPDAFSADSHRQRVLIIGGLDGSRESVAGAFSLLKAAVDAPDRRADVACLPIANPDGWAAGQGPGNLSGGTVAAGYPPTGTAYNDPQNPEAHCLWRFIAWYAPDVVIDVHDETSADWQSFLESGKPAWSPDGLARQVRETPVAGIATVRAVRFVATRKVALPGDAEASAVSSLGTLHWANNSVTLVIDGDYTRGGAGVIEESYRSPLRLEIERRSRRSPLEVADELSAHYGHALTTVMYQPALALVARVRLGELTGKPAPRRDVERIVAEYLDGSRSTLGENTNGSQLAGHLIFAELASLTGDKRAIALVKRAADFAFDEQGQPREAMPFHSEMSDAVFMACPILAAAGRLTGDDKYFAMAARHLRFMQDRCLRPDGIYRHSPLCEAAWGRGNGFPALGLALSLSDVPAGEEPANGVSAEAATRFRQLARESLVAHLRSLVPHQDATGMWCQVIDDPGSYREMTATCMITFALVRGIRSGWLPADEFGPVAERAWRGIAARVGQQGVLFDVCTGTGKQKSLQDYRDRTAILGVDERGGAMALMVAVEMAAWSADRSPGTSTD